MTFEEYDSQVIQPTFERILSKHKAADPNNDGKLDPMDAVERLLLTGSLDGKTYNILVSITDHRAGDNWLSLGMSGHIDNLLFDINKEPRAAAKLKDYHIEGIVAEAFRAAKRLISQS